MAKIYEALQKAEEERKRKGAVRDQRTPDLDWDSTPQSVESAKAGVAERVRRWFFDRSSAVSSAYENYNRCRISLIQPESYAAEQFRTLRGRIDALATQRPVHSVAVISPNPGEGKTTAAINLAAVTAMGVGQRVVLVDCDLRQPSVAGVLGIEPLKGVSEILSGDASIDEAIIRMEDPGFDVIAVRSLPANPSELLASERMAQLIEDLGQRYDRVVVDTPAALGLPDVKALAEICDGLLVVVRAGRTPSESIEMVLELVDRRRVLGLMLNDDVSAPRAASSRV